MHNAVLTILSCLNNSNTMLPFKILTNTFSKCMSPHKKGFYRLIMGFRLIHTYSPYPLKWFEEWGNLTCVSKYYGEKGHNSISHRSGTTGQYVHPDFIVMFEK